MKKYVCPVCAYPDLDDPPRQAGSPSDEICPSCGFQFGYTDDDSGYTYAEWRRKWVAEGMPWSEIGIEEPPGWDPGSQLANVEPQTDVEP